METTASDIREFELEVTLQDGSKQEYDYQRRDGEVRAQVEMRAADGSEHRQSPGEAVATAERLLRDLAPSRQMSRKELLGRACAVLHLDEEAIARLEVEVEFGDGTEIEAKMRA